MRIKLITILAIILAPLIIAITLLKLNYKGVTTQAGNLISPPINISKFVTLPSNKWHLLYINSTSDQVEQDLVTKHFNQIKNINDPKRITINILQTTKNSHPQTIKTSLINMKKLLKQTHNQKIMIVDPRGFIVLSYTGKTWPIQLNQDLKKLLKLSQIG